MKLVSEAMNRSLVTVMQDAPMADVVALVRRTGAEHVLVMEDQILVGILCACDLRGASPEEPVRDRMSVPVVTVRPDTELCDAAATMCEQGVGCLPVTVGGLILGTVSEAEIERAGVGAPHPRCPHTHRRASRFRH
ncbi:MAG TPA: CBS domain-containing protein [Anaeromyxobacter sp.]|nr:CBS domain-containing protein [Anaeromyxobacter sp.]